MSLKQDLIKMGIRLEGDFTLKSGIESSVKWDVEKLFDNTKYHERRELLSPWLRKIIKVVHNWSLPNWIVGIPTGGYLLSLELGFSCSVIMAGYKLPYPGRVLIVDDVLTTGTTVRKVLADLNIPTLIAAIAVLVNRSGLKEIDGVPIVSGIEADIVKQEVPG